MYNSQLGCFKQRIWVLCRLFLPSWGFVNIEQYSRRDGLAPYVLCFGTFAPLDQVKQHSNGLIGVPKSTLLCCVLSALTIMDTLMTLLQSALGLRLSCVPALGLQLVRDVQDSISISIDIHRYYYQLNMVAVAMVLIF